jgi:GAF domain-containing protein
VALEADEPKVSHLRTLNWLSQLLSSSPELNEILKSVARAARELTGARLVSVWVANEGARTLELRAHSDRRMGEDHPARRLAFGEGGAGWVALHRRRLAVPDLLADPRLRAREWFERHGLRSAVALPIVHGESLEGVLALLGTEPFDLTEPEHEVLDSFVAQAAVAIHTARLFEESERRRRTAEALAQVGHLLTRGLDVEATTQRILESVCHLLDARSAALYGLEPSGELVVQAVSDNPGRSFVWVTRLLPGTGLASLALREGAPVATPDGLADGRVVFVPEAVAGIADAPDRALLAVPLSAGGRPRGVVCVGAETGRVFADDELRIVQAFADQAALALENARLYTDSERRRAESESLADVGRLVSQSLDPAEVGQRITDSLCQLVGARVAVMYSLASAHGDFVMAAGTGPAESWNPSLGQGAGAVGLAVAERRPVTTSDVLDDPRIVLGPEARDRLEGSRHRAVLALPLVVKDRPIGGVVVGDATGRVFTGEQIALAQAFVDQAATAFENAQLHAETTRQRQIAERLAEVGRLVSESLDLEEVAQRIADSVRSLLGTTHSALYELDGETATLVAIATSGPWGLAGARIAFPVGVGVTGRAIQDRRPVTSRNVLADPEFRVTPALRALIEAAGYHAVLALPLLMKGRVVGCLAVGDVEGRAFTTEEIATTKAFADQAALALENARLYAGSERRRREAEALAALAKALTAIDDLRAVCQRVVETALELFGGRRAVVRLAEPDGSLRVVATTGVPSFPVGHTFPPGEGMAARILATGLPLQTPDLAAETGLAIPEELRQRLVGKDDRALVGVPLRAKEEVIGTLLLVDQAGRVYPDDEVAVLQAFADQAALAVASSRSLEQVRDHQARLEMLLEVSHEVSRIQSADSLLPMIAEACAQLLGATNARLYLLEGEELVQRAAWGDPEEMAIARRVPRGDGHAGLVAETGQTVAIPDLAAEPRWPELHQRLLGQGYRSWLGVPVLVGDRTVGVLSVHGRDVGAFRDYDLTIAKAFAAQAGTVLENARLFQEVKQAYVELTRTQDQLVQSQKMEAIGRLAGGIAHDFNNILTIIHGRSEILVKRLTADERSRHDIGLIQQTARRAAALTRQLLAFSRQQVLQPKVLDLNEVVGSMGDMLRRLIGEDIELVLARDPGLGRVKADPGQIDQIVLNLAVNARDAMPGGGSLTIETANADLDAEFVAGHVGARPGPHVRLTVRDTGSGMSPETLAHVFEPFFTTKAPGKGTGLGLSTVYGIVRQHDGYIAVTSREGAGAAFDIYLPRVDGQAAAGQPAAAKDTGRGTETILLVEDESDVRELAREILEQAGYRVIEATSGAEALVLTRSAGRAPDLLLTDVIMPRMSGAELARELAPLAPAMRVAFMSGYTDDALGHHGVLDPGTILLEKPFTPDSLLAGVRAALDR